MSSIHRQLNFAFFSILSSLVSGAFAQAKPAIAVLNIDTKGMVQDPQAMGYMVRLELEKTGVYSVLDRYETAEMLTKNNLQADNCFSKSCLVEAGKKLGVSKMLSGNIERFGEKIVITLRLIDVASGTIEKSEATEYLNLPEVQKMISISVAKISGLQPDPALASVLIDYNTPIENANTSFTNNGPRMGVSYTIGDAAKRLRNHGPGDFGAYPVIVQFAWQQEIAYISAGNFQALVEFIPAIGGLESSLLIPSLSVLQGFRVGKLGLEIALGPIFRLVKVADVYYDAADGTWHLAKDGQAGSNPIKTLPDTRGDLKLSTSLLVVAGVTIHSGYLNIPLNVYCVPRPDATVAGFSFGFNVHKKKSVE